MEAEYNAKVEALRSEMAALEETRAALAREKEAGEEQQRQLATKVRRPPGLDQRLAKGGFGNRGYVRRPRSDAYHTFGAAPVVVARLVALYVFKLLVSRLAAPTNQLYLGGPCMSMSSPAAPLAQP